MINVGDQIPAVPVRILTESGVTQMSAFDIMKKGITVLVGVPGAYSPNCHLKHLPSYVDHFEHLRSVGADRVLLIAKNDVFVLFAWHRDANAPDDFVFLSDIDLEFANAAGLTKDLVESGMGICHQRYSLIVKDGHVRFANIETAPGVNISDAETAIEQVAALKAEA